MHFKDIGNLFNFKGSHGLSEMFAGTFKGYSSLKDMQNVYADLLNKEFKIGTEGISEFTTAQIEAKAAAMELTDSLTTELISIGKDATLSQKAATGKLTWGKALQDTKIEIEDLVKALKETEILDKDQIQSLDDALKLEDKDLYRSILTDIINDTEGFSDTIINFGDNIEKVGPSLGTYFKGMVANIKPLVPYIAAVTAAITAFKVWDYSQHNYSRAFEDAENSASEYEQTQSNLQSLNAELDTTKSRIQELQSLQSAGTITLAEESELATLARQNDELERQIGIQKNLLDVKQQAAAQAAKTASETEMSYTEAMEKEHGTFLGKLLGFIGNLGTFDPSTGMQLNAKTAKQTWTDQYEGDTTLQGQVKGNIQLLEEYQESFKNVQELLKENPTDEGLLKQQENLTAKISDTTASLTEQSQTLQQWIDQSTDANGKVTKGFEPFVDNWRSILTDIQNIGKSQEEIDLNNLNNFFSSKRGSAIESVLSDIVSDSKNAEDALKKFKQVGLSLNDIGVSENGFIKYFESIAHSAQETEKAINTIDGSVEGVKSAFESENQDADWNSMSDYLKQADELYKKGKIGTDDFKAAAQFMSKDLINPDSTKYDADAYAAVWEAARDKIKRYFDAENPADSMYNFTNDLVNKGLASDENGDITWKFKTSAEAAKALGLSVEAAEVAMHNLESYGAEFDDVMFSGEGLTRYENALNGIKSLYDSMEEGDSKKRLEGLISNWDSELEGYQNDLSTLTEDQIIHIEFEYDLASIQAKIDELTAEQKGQGSQDAITNGSILAANESYISTAKEGLGLNNEGVDLSVRFKPTEDAIDSLYSQLQKEESGSDKFFEIQAKIQNAQEIQKDLFNAFSEQHPEINADSNFDEIAGAWESFFGQAQHFGVKGELDIGSIEAQMESLAFGSTIKFNVDDKEITALKNEDGTISYTANVDGVEQTVNVVKNEDGTITYTVNEVEGTKVDKEDKSITQTVNEVEGTKVSKDSKDTIQVVNQELGIEVPTTAPDATQTVNRVIGTNVGLSLPSITQIVNRKIIEQKASGTLLSPAHANGTAYNMLNLKPAYVGGKVALSQDEDALVNELGTESIIRDGVWSLLPGKMHIQSLKKGDIILNAEQTRDLLNSGKTNSHAKSYANGTLMNAYANGWRIPKGVKNNLSSKKKKPSSSNNSSPSPSPAPDNSSSDSAKDFKETIDYIEMAIDRIERQIKNVERIAGSAYNTFAKRNNALKDQLSSINEELDIQQAGYDRYIQEADSVSLSEDYKNQVRNGTIDISTITDESLAENIKDFQQWYEKALDCRDAVEELKESVRDLYKEAFDNVVTLYDGMLGQIEHRQKILEGFIDQTETQGYIVSTRYYDALISNEQGKLEKLIKQRQDSIAAMNDAIINGNIEVNSEQWYEFQEEINKVNEEIQDAETSLIKFNNSIRELKWDVFDKIQDRISGITDEADFLIDLMSSQDMYDDEGNVTKQGTATYGLHGVNYNVYMSQADQYKKEMESIQEELSKDPHNETLIERRKELLELQQESILAAEEEKEAIKSLVEDGIEKELDALDKLIDKYLDAIDSEKDLRDYQKKVESQQSEVSSLEKQLSAYVGDDSEEGSAKRQQLQNDLKEARENLEETQYEKAISDQKKLLDELYSEYETVLNMRLDNIDQLIASVIENVNLQADEIRETLATETGKVGYQLTDSMNTIWGTNGTFANILTTYGNNFTSILTSVQTAINDIKLLIQNAVTQSDASAESNITATNEQQAEQTTVPAEPPTPEPPAPESHNGGDGVPRIGDAVTFASGRYYYDSEGTNPSGNQMLGQQVYITSINNASWARKQYHISKGSRLGAEDLGWVSLDQLEGYKTGKNYINKDQLAWTQEDGPELVVSRSDGAILTPLKQGDAVINNSETERLLRLARDPYGYLQENLHKQMPGISSVFNGSNPSFKNEFVINIAIDKVMDYNDFITKFRNDKQTERIVQAMTIDRLAGKNSLAKYNIRIP